MKRVFWALLTLAATIVAADEAANPPFVWLQHYGSSEHDNWRARKDGIAWPKVLWRVPEAHGEPTFDEKTLYAGGPELLAIDRRTGKVEARVAAGGYFRFAQAPVLTPDAVIARRSDGLIVAYARDLGKKVWEFKDEGFGADTRLTGSLRGGLYLYAAGNRVRALDARNGKLAWSADHPGPGMIHMVPAADDRRVYAGTVGGTFAAFDLKSGKVMWEHEAATASYGYCNPVVVEGVALVGDRGLGEDRTGELRAFDAKTGRALWSFPFRATGLSTPGHAPGRALLGYGRWAASLELKTQQVDRIPTGTNAYGSPTVVGRTFYFGNLDGHLYAHDATRGDLLWKFRVGGTDAKDPLLKQVYDFVHTGTEIYVATSHGLFCLVQDPEKRGKLPNGAVIEGRVPGG